jgi:hypothetical protein
MMAASHHDHSTQEDLPQRDRDHRGPHERDPAHIERTPGRADNERKDGKSTAHDTASSITNVVDREPPIPLFIVLATVNFRCSWELRSPS